MPDAQVVSDLIEKRFARAMDGVRDRIEQSVVRHMHGRRAVVRLEIRNGQKWEHLCELDPHARQAADLFHVRATLYLGEGQYVAVLTENDQTEELAFDGHLQRTATEAGREFRMVAL